MTRAILSLRQTPLSGRRLCESANPALALTPLSPPFGHVLFAYLEACGAPICPREGFAQRLGLHIAIVGENELSNRCAQAFGLSLSVWALHAPLADIFGLAPVGNVLGYALLGGLVPQ